MAKLIRNVLVSEDTVMIGVPLATPLYQTESITDNPAMHEQQLEDCRAQAWQEGYAAGKEDEHALLTQKMGELKQQLETLFTSIPQAITDARQQLSGDIADIVLLITQQYFIERQSDPEALKLQIDHILSQLTSKQNVELYLHPQDIKALQKGIIQLETAHLNGLIIREDNHIRLGGCMVKTEHGIFDVSIEKQVDKLKHFLLQIKEREHHVLPN